MAVLGGTAIRNRACILRCPFHRDKAKTPSSGSLVVVAVPRFELGTSRTRTVRSTGLSHAPISFGNHLCRRSDAPKAEGIIHAGYESCKRGLRVERERLAIHIAAAL